MPEFWKQHVFTAELPYEKDAVVTLFLIDNFERVDDFIMSLGQMSNIPPSRLFVYSEGELTKTIMYSKNNLQGSGFSVYFLKVPKALLFVTYDLFKALKRIDFSCDIFFAQHFLPAFIAVILRKMRIFRCKKIYFMMFDFFLIPPQFPRGLYYWGVDLVQRYVRKNIDEIWYTTPRLEESDQERHGALPNTVKKRITGPRFFRRIEVNKAPEVPPLRLAFLGSLRGNNGIWESVNSVLFCVKQGMKVELHVIGSGTEEKRLKAYLREENVEDAVKLFGFIDDGDEIANIFSKCHLGIALYPSDPYGPNWFLTSGKFRRFISQGLPVITSTVPYFGKYIYDYNAGFVVDNDPEEVRKVLQTVYDNPSELIELKQGVENLYNRFNTDRVLKELFRNSFSREAIS